MIKKASDLAHCTVKHSGYMMLISAVEGSKVSPVLLNGMISAKLYGDSLIQKQTHVPYIKKTNIEKS